MYRQAIQEFEKLVQKEPDFLLARIYLAMGYLKQGELPEAKDISSCLPLWLIMLK
ncbi:tetratricopeptide repeat protein [Paenibacillus larvae]|uniref:tetratricopeptide repeat protein n=1 Tax=Paenibacillus larvae TaxID=1464 RepID=UPI00288E2512|nr:tetratricopeptide repeat protein [Paenibacillus larvae]MDT2275603.1 tetratricopeptide repeat protein [Paenibacillus larvae]